MKLKIITTEGVGGLPPHVRAEATLPDREDSRTVQGEGVTEAIAISKLIRNNAEFLGISIERTGPLPNYDFSGDEQGG